ncbi:methylmalonyl-CoA mutase family protein [Rhodohalobacter sp.]|uniref:methylmalonyl-CoA mutase family protein n=1 Tax=Rhodohalobacter sp. TaxID=1974210 RepID=UPI002ACDA3AD|nr:methylmalonyl-CoA mutase family protein [Rhodohalobacter sp.]MDZ7758479.1 methylmalonyl-CoA mutase family protein [Rhodohalobacter sp.]
MNKQKETNLFSEFEPVSRQQWEEQIKKDLKGADYKQKLKWDTLEGLTPQPFYRSDDLEDLELYHLDSVRTNIKSAWKRCELISESDPVKANAELKESIKGGADAFQIKCDISYSDGALSGNMIGTQIQSQKNFNDLVSDIDFSDYKVLFNSGMNTPAIFAMVQNSDTEIQDASFFFDPFTYTAKHGREPVPSGELNSLIRQLASKNDFNTLCADGLFYHTSGASIVQELGISLAIASEYLASSNKDYLNQTARSILFRLSAGPLYFPEIAKFRAARILWANLLDAYGIDDSLPLNIHTETTPQNQTLADPHNNTLRATTEAMSAVIGGVDSLMIQPYDSQFKSSSSFSSRIARNIQHIIAEEAHFGKVDDPAAGSYYIEQLTEEISQKSWEFFQLIEKQGGFLDALKNRIIQTEIETFRNKKLEAYATGKRTLVGTNNYPNSDEKLPDPVITTDYTDSLKTTDHSASIDSTKLIDSLSENLKNGQLIGDLFKSYLEPQKVLYTSLEPFRAAEIFESIRHRTQEYAESAKTEPSVQLVPVGNMKWRKLRATFASNMLGCAGFAIDSPIGFDSVEIASEKLDSDSSDIYVLCGADDEYPEFIKPFCDAFRKKGILVLAGNPKDKEAEFRKFGIDHFIYSGMNIPEILSEIQDQIFNTEKASS